MKKKVIIAIIAAMAIVALISIPSIVENRTLKNTAKIAIDRWAEENGISINSFTVKHDHHSFYDITIKWEEFESLNPAKKREVVYSWSSEYSEGLPYIFYLDSIISHRNEYKVNTSNGAVELNGKTIVEGYKFSSTSSSSSSGSSSSSPSKTATCNYCNGTGKVNGEKCPWCNGSGKTYDNSFNDLFK